ncbi:MAG TPA: hypothetical protein VKR62_14725, partial [Roseiarcus sp.]|nr:hypothetical protein [Roseiarcus sp.]
WTIAIFPRKARKRGLDFLGFPWILSSGMSFFNGLRGLFAEGNFSPFCRRGRRAWWAPVFLQCGDAVYAIEQA